MWIRNEPTPRKRKAIKHLMPCGYVVKAHTRTVFNRWVIEIFTPTSKIGRSGILVASFMIDITPDNANSIFQLLQKLVHNTEGVEKRV